MGSLEFDPAPPSCTICGWGDAERTVDNPEIPSPAPRDESWLVLAEFGSDALDGLLDRLCRRLSIWKWGEREKWKNEEKKSEARMIASVLKHNPNTQKVKKNTVY